MCKKKTNQNAMSVQSQTKHIWSEKRRHGSAVTSSSFYICTDYIAHNSYVCAQNTPNDNLLTKTELTQGYIAYAIYKQ